MRRLTLVPTLLLFIMTQAFGRVTPLPDSHIPLAQMPLRSSSNPWSGALDDHFNVRVNSDQSGQLQNEEMVCISPVNPNNFVAVWRDFRLGYRRVAYGYSTNHGQTWTDNLFPAAFYPWQSDPVLTVDPTGVFTAMMISYNPDVPSENGFLQVNSSDGGQTWHDSVWAVNSLQPISFEDKEMLTVDALPTSPYYGNKYVVWTHFYGIGPTYDSSNVWFVVQQPGHAYSLHRQVSQTPSVQWPNVATATNGDILVSWVSYAPQGIMFSRSTNLGVTWRDQTLVVPTNFAAATINPNLQIFAYGALAVDYSTRYHGRIYMVYTDKNLNQDDTDIWLIHSDNNGNTWSTPVLVNDNQQSSPVDHFHPWVSVDEQGRVWVAFYDRRNDPNNILMDVYYTVTTNGGINWRTNERITDVSSNPAAGSLDAGLIGEYIGWQVRNGKAVCAWTDTRLGNQDVFAAPVDSVYTSEAVDERSSFILHPSSFSAYPNPTNSRSVLRFILDSPADVHLKVYNVIGETVRESDLGSQSGGEHEYDLDLADLGTGLYIAELSTSRESVRTKIVLLR